MSEHPPDLRPLPLPTPTSFRYEERERVKFQRESEGMQQECTFKPKLGKKTRRTAKSLKRGKGQSVVTRLYNEADQRVAEREKQKRQLEQQQMQSHSYQPNINPSTERILARRDRASHRPIHQRIGELQRAKSENLQRLRMQQQYDDVDLTFRPQVGEKSHYLALSKQHQTGESTNAATRLTETANDQLQRRMRIQQEHYLKEQRECRFQPVINENSRAIVADMREFQGDNKDFVTRQENMQKVRAGVGVWACGPVGAA